MNVVAFDSRAQHVLENKVHALDAWDDVDSLAAESRAYLQVAHESHITDDWREYLHSITAINNKLVLIRRIARARKGEIESATVVSKDQLAIWTREDGAVVAERGTAA